MNNPSYWGTVYWGGRTRSWNGDDGPNCRSEWLSPDVSAHLVSFGDQSRRSQVQQPVIRSGRTSNASGLPVGDGTRRYRPLAIAVVVVVGAAASVPTALHPASASGLAHTATAHNSAGWARPNSVGLPPGWTQTWSTHALADPGHPIALSSPIPANLDGQPSVVVGDRGGTLYGMHLVSPSPTAVRATNWPVTSGNGPIDSTPSVLPGSGLSTVLVGSGNDFYPVSGGYQAFTASGARKWFTPVVNPPSDTSPAGGVQAGLSVGNLTPGVTQVFAGSLGQVAYALDAADGAPLKGWPFFNSDSTHATASLADLYGTGQTQIVVGGDQTTGSGRGQSYTDGGHIRILTGTGNQICRADTDQVVDSSPAVGTFLTGGATGIVTGTGTFYPGASTTNVLLAYDARCRIQWSAMLDGSTFSSPALSDVLGNGTLQVVEGTDQGSGNSGSVWVLDGTTGRTIWKQANIGRVIGSVVTADLSGSGYNDVIVPTISGTDVFDGRTGNQIATLSPFLGLQNAPLVTDDPNGTIGITLAGYIGGAPGGIGQIDHYEIPRTGPADAVGPGSWPMFHHDPQLTGTAGGGTVAHVIPACQVPSAVTTGYVLAASDGGLFNFPSATPFCGSAGAEHLVKPVVGVDMAPSTGGYWEVASDGGIFTYGGAPFLGSMGGRPLNSPIVGMAVSLDGRGYWEVASDGGVFAFGDAPFLGSMGGSHLNKPIVGISVTADGKGYRLVAADGGIFSFGDAPFSGSTGAERLNAPVVATVNDPNTGGYWEVAADGGIFSFGDAPFFGSAGGIVLNSPVVGMAETANGSGYELVAADGGVFAFGSAAFLGSMGGKPLAAPVVGIAGF